MRSNIPSRATARAGVVVAALCLVPGACTPSRTVLLADAAAATASVSTFSSEGTITATYAAGGQIVVHLAAQYDLAANNSALELRRDDIRMTVQMRAVDGSSYVRMIFAGEPDVWRRAVAGEQDDEVPIDHPEVLLDELVRAAQGGQPEVVGREEVRGQPTTHHRVSADDTDYDAWVDADGRIVRVVEASSSDAFAMRLDAEYSGFGEPVAIAPPERFTDRDGESVAWAFIGLFTAAPNTMDPSARFARPPRGESPAS